MINIWHANLLEIIWTSIGLVGIYLTWGNQQSTRKELHALRRLNGGHLSKYGVMRVIAYGHYRNDLFRFSKCLVIVAVGFTACILPPPPTTPSGPATPVGVAITLGFFAIEVLVVLASALDARQRDYLRGLSREARTPPS